MSGRAGWALRRGKWAATAASVWIQCTSGASYCFSIYSPALKASQGYTQSTLNSVAFFKDVGANVGVLSGLLYSSACTPSGTPYPAATRGGGGWKGPWVVIAAGAVQCLVGYLFMWLSVAGELPRQPVALMCLYMLLAAHAQTFFNTACVVTAVRNFPGSRGTGVGIMKGYLGLSGAILIQLHRTIYPSEPSKFILMLALLPSILPLVLMFWVTVDDKKEENDMKRLNGFSIVSMAVAGYLMLLIIWGNIWSIKPVAQVLTFLILLLLLVSPLYIVIAAEKRDSNVLSERMPSENTWLVNQASSSEDDEKNLLERKAKRVYNQHDNVVYNELPSHSVQQLLDPGNDLLKKGTDLNILQAMQTAEFWLLFFAMSLGMGSGLATINNISQIGEALNYTAVEINTMVSLWSIWNFLGRFGGGYVSDYFLQSRGTARPLFIALTLAAMSIGHFIISSGLPDTLYVGSVLVGVCYGCQWSLMPTITSELFGVMHMGTIFNTISIASPVGSYILSVRVVGFIYDLEAVTSGTTTCTGIHCFRLAFFIMASVSILGFLIALVLYFRTRKFYEQVIVTRMQYSSTR